MSYEEVHNALMSVIYSKLGSIGNTSYTLMVDYGVERLPNGFPISVKLSQKDDEDRVQFGYYRKVVDGSTRRSEFLQVKEINNVIMNRILNNKFFGVDFGDIERGVPFVVEVNETFRIINIVRVHLRNFIDNVYKTGTISKISYNGKMIDGSTVAKLHKSVSIYLAKSYYNVIDGRVSKAIMSTDIKYSSVKSLLTTGTFMVPFVTGPCFINPFLDNPRFMEWLKDSYLDKALHLTESLKDSNNRLEGVSYFLIGDSRLYPITHKEVCRSLGMPKFVIMRTRQFIEVLLGLFYPGEFLSNTSSKFVVSDSDEDKVFNTYDQAIEAGYNARDVKSVSTIYLSVSRNQKMYSQKDKDLLVNMIQNATLEVAKEGDFIYG